ncbi:MAG TPA: FAD-dependent oxidoreductase [Terracidiphilus sp.]|jgi:thioredoxin reductase
MKPCDVTIIGAGPYGLSAAAHLSAAGLDVQVFGEPMEFWANGMPDGMLLRSPREASTIADPRSALTLEAYEGASRTKPVKRVARETFVNYGRWFQKNLKAELDRREVTEVRRDGSSFRLTLADGEVHATRRVVVAGGVGPFRRMPEPFASLPPSRASHCYEGRSFRDFGKRVVVIGAGQSALESAALLKEAGADVEVIARISGLRWIGMHPRLHNLGFISKTLYSKYDVGPIGVSRLVAYPNLMYPFPMGLKDRIRKRAVRSAGAPWLISRLDGVKITLETSVLSAKEIGDDVELRLSDGSERRVDHVLAATGYDVNISRYKFISPELVNEVRQLDGYPDVGAGFSTSVPGLHFIGATAARKFGPLLYFVAGTEFASRELTSWIRRRENKKKPN